MAFNPNRRPSVPTPLVFTSVCNWRLVNSAAPAGALLIAAVCAAWSLTASGRTTSSIDRTRSVSKTSQAQVRGSSHDFDFLYGRWTVHNRMLQKRLAGSQTWVQFKAADAFHALPGNMGTEENFSTEHWKHFKAIGLNLYNPANGQWKLYWTDNHNSPGTMQTLASGAFSNGVGTFYAPDTFDGKPITVRIIWKQQGRNHVRWVQAFSTDHGKSWETNWIMDFTRS